MILYWLVGVVFMKALWLGYGTGGQPEAGLDIYPFTCPIYPSTCLSIHPLTHPSIDSYTHVWINYHHPVAICATSWPL